MVSKIMKAIETETITVFSQALMCGKGTMLI